MAGCRAVMCTAGFESVSEAAVLGKPVLMVPVEDHLEQMLNALDGELSRVGISHPIFDLDALSHLPAQVDTGWFREWCGQAGRILVRVVAEAATGEEWNGGSRNHHYSDGTAELGSFQPSSPGN